MSRQSGISERYLRSFVSAVDPQGPTGPGDFIPGEVLREIADLIGCDEAVFQVMEAGRRTMLCQYDSAPDGLAVDLAEDPSIEEMMRLFWASYWDSPACNYPQRTGDHRTVTRLSDFGTRVALRRASVGAFLAEAEIKHELFLPMPPDGPRDERILLFRDDGKDFTERDVLMLTLLRPHLVALRRRHASGPAPRLTPRQLEVLALVAAGYTNGQAARSLGVASGTVRKHLENAFERLEVSSRSAAIVKVLPQLEFRAGPF
ncbi:helix-turn-helix transcriptional regulator [Microlunatus speluncae]|uniref:helix-turn-helix transcriptional regulator n=1 Tax=Microlunatus speluncae TaxID=2594267 RepID=UPI0012664335|nr:LuxR C-terminal-related transcriptional regulator [Microlunatus speluncae]